ncbi:disintegrin and metalloproteinase domain-containing protein 33 isoform X2 [Varanus komodoensis]|uniref:disintegrin and metalloproteinase domain-containing protein 33 isoform X2 n=1 Tax=Varanus komodoensis TaxID=61221 RepID=UPI001CF7B7DE|nr:disintegrin and metalloproteinase domain-containing protein 33 isoform X2 [Varanus komodoensis]
MRAEERRAREELGAGMEQGARLWRCACGGSSGQRRPLVRCSALLLLLQLLQLLPPSHGDSSGRRGLSPHGESVTPYWILGGRSRRAAGVAEEAPSPPRGDMVVTVEGQELVLELEKNQLLAPEYTETHYTKDGQPVTLSPSHTDHCYYHGQVRGHSGSWVVLSTCSGISGLIALSHNNSYYLKPPAHPESAAHTIFRAEHLPIRGGTCGHGDPLQSSVADVARSFEAAVPRRKRRDAWRTLKYMELFIVADYTLFTTQNNDLGRTKQRILEIANYVDKFYRSLNIKVALIGLEVWTKADQCAVSSDAHATLVSFLQWKKSLKSRKKHDNAQLLTGVTFKGTTIGMAPLEGMCSAENSGGVSMDHSELPIGAAATMAHEIGHNFGMSHDSEGCCVEATASQGGCVMAAATGHPFPKVFSSCSRRQLDGYFQRGGGMCLFNMPNTKDLVVGKKCGNGFLEDGEECDCGEVEECRSPCCNAHNCTLKAGAQCAHGDCCEDCKLKEAGAMCREPAGTCDLPEYCTGASPYCPTNVYLLDGSPCAHGEAYCYNGMCMTHHQQCIHLWGPGASPAPDACFEDVNRAGDMYGNCGRDRHGQYVKCARRDAKCGKIQCHSSAIKPKGTNTISMDTTIRLNGREIKCRGTLVYTTKDDSGDMADPGLVMTGTKCSEAMVCKDQRCQNASFFELDKCVTKCHEHGVCNSNGNCHCNAGWAPPFCEKPGLGGSVDSGPVQYDSHKSTWIGLAMVLLACLVTIPVALYVCNRKERSFFWKTSKAFRKNREACRNGDVRQKADCGHQNSAFTLQTVVAPSSGKAVGRSSSQATRSMPVLKPSPHQSASHPVNVVRPLRPPPSPAVPLPKDFKPSRPPPLPSGKSPHPAVPTKATPAAQAKLPPPKKPLPSSPARTHWVDLKQRPPRKPLPGNPLLAKERPSAQGQALLVMVPPSNSKAAAGVSSGHFCKPLKPSPPQRPAPGLKVQSASFPSRK